MPPPGAVPGGSRKSGNRNDFAGDVPPTDDSVVDVVLRLNIGSIRNLLKDELTLVERERGQHAEEVANYTALKAKIATTHFGTYVNVDVGGTVFKTSVSTLSREKGSMLALMFRCGNRTRWLLRQREGVWAPPDRFSDNLCSSSDTGGSNLSISTAALVSPSSRARTAPTL